jgi:hypothetical protein
MGVYVFVCNCFSFFFIIVFYYSRLSRPRPAPFPIAPASALRFRALRDLPATGLQSEPALALARRHCVLFPISVRGGRLWALCVKLVCLMYR